MPRLPGPLRRWSWMVLLDLAMVARRHWQAVPVGERSRLNEILRRTKGRPAALTPADRDALRDIMRHVDKGALARDLMPFGRRFPRRR
jgi:hypothetical protein